MDIIGFFREKLKADTDLSDKDQLEIDEFIRTKLRNHSSSNVVYNIYKILHFELELEKCNQNIKECNFELA